MAGLWRDPCFDPSDLSSKREWTQIGDGSFGNVYKASLLGTNVAVKEIGNLKPDRVAGLKRDMFYLRRFPHPNIVTVFGGYEEDGKLYMVMEYMAHSLRSRSVVNRVDVVRVLSDVARALVRLHAAGHVHRDVKARNVLITRGYETAKLCDFGLARTMPDESRDDVNPELTPRIGPPKYRAPEVVKRRDYGTSSDMYVFGIMCQQLVKELKKKRRRAIGEEEVEFILNLASECLRKDPGTRPTAGECLKRLLEYRGKSLQLCSRETAKKRVGYWIDAPMDVGTFKHAGKEPTVSSDPSSSDTPSDDANGGGGEDSDVLRVREGGTEHGDEEDEVTGGGAHKRRRVDDDGGDSVRAHREKSPRERSRDPNDGGGDA